MTQKATGDDWESHWTRYADAAQLNPAQVLRHDSVLHALKAHRTPAARLLDIGSGQGDFLARAVAADAAIEYAGFELSAAGVKLSRAKVPKADFLELDLLSPAPDAERYTGWATAAVCCEVIEHVDDPATFLSSLRNYLADNATLILTVPGGPMSTFDHHIGHRRHYTSSSTRQVLTDAGFKVDAVQRAGFPFFNLYRLLVIVRGQRLVDEADAKAGGEQDGIARLAMQAFGFLFRFTFGDFPLGWQIIAVARKA